ncbi:unnamed protein product [Echinostoma caproni]|uniref:Transforming acidic coiled-coil-containing protein C-terminal domain-containing protein n=1 Tax=Echinostoma caproni TaxID=27848 RepID=A0A3P8IKB0_9TREM|nr:unnamed protein product [Echinostoma caproni]
MISPLNVDPSIHHITSTTPATPLSTGFTPVASSALRTDAPVSTGPASPFVFSPWMHRSILDQALGGGDGERSPEWTEPTETESASAAQPLVTDNPVLPEPLQLSTCQSDTTAQTDLSQSYASAVALSDAGDFDMLASLLERVNVRQEEADSKLDDSSGCLTGETAYLERTPGKILLPPVAPDTYNVHSRSNPSKYTHPIQHPSVHAEPIEPSPTMQPTPQARRRTINLNSASALAPIVDAVCPSLNFSDCAKTTTDSQSGRLSIGSISDMVTMAARSLYDRIGGNSGLVARSPIAMPVVPIVSSPAVQQTLPKLTDPLEPPSCCSNLSPSSMAPGVQSVDEDVWESVNSENELRSTMVIDTSIRSIAGRTFELSDENKENIHVPQTDISQPCYPSRQNHLGESMADAVSPGSSMNTDSNSSRPLTSFQNSGLHETQATPHLTASGDGPEELKVLTKLPDSSVHQEAAVAEMQLLRHEVGRLRALATELRTVMHAYEQALLEADASEREQCVVTTARIHRIAAERDEAMEQAATMMKAYDDMYRRVQRAKESIETRKERQKAAVQCIERYANRVQTIGDKFAKMHGYYLDHLSEALTTVDRQEDEWHRKLDKLQLELRQHELRNTTLANEISLKVSLHPTDFLTHVYQYPM